MARFAPLFAALFVLAAGWAVAGESPKSTEVKWFDSWDEAAAAAKAEKKPILADFTGSDWCGWCMKLNNEVFSSPEFDAWARQNVILLRLDYPHHHSQPAELKKQNERLAGKYGIRGFPTVLFLDPDGKILGKTGYEPGGPANWVKSAERYVH